MTLFDKCIEIILVNEGGYQCNPKDLGNWTGPNRTGECKGTKYGICTRYFPHLDIKNLTISQAKEIYRLHYWNPMNLEGIFNELAVLQIFDFGVNAGKGRAIRTAQNIVQVKADGICGPMTRGAINSYSYDFVQVYKTSRIMYYQLLGKKDPDNAGFVKGWIRRVNDTHFNH